MNPHLTRRTALTLAITATGLGLGFAALTGTPHATAQGYIPCEQWQAMHPGWPCIDTPQPPPGGPPTLSTPPPLPSQTPGQPGNGGGIGPGALVPPPIAPGNGTPIVPAPGAETPGLPGNQPPAAPAPGTVAPQPIPAAPPQPTETPPLAPQAADTPTPIPPVPTTTVPTPSTPTESKDHSTAAEPSDGPDQRIPLLLLAGAAAFIAPAFRPRNAAASHQLTITKPWGGEQTFILMTDPAAPRTYRFPQQVPPGGQLRKNPDGSVDVLDAEGQIMSHTKAPWAYDALGRPVRTWYETDGDTLVQHIEPDADSAYPILADPDTDPFGKPDVTGRQEGDTWTTQLPDGRTVTNHIPMGNGTQTVDQTIPDGKGGLTNSRITENGQGGYQRWNDDSSGTASYSSKDTSDTAVYGQSFDKGASTSGTPSHEWGASSDYQHTATPTYDGNGNQTGVVYGDQRSDGYWNSAVRDNQGNTTYLNGGSDGEGGITNTVTGQVKNDGTGWRTLEDGRKVEVYTDGNDNPVMVTSDPKTGHQSYRYLEDGIVQENAFDKEGRWIGHTEYRSDGTTYEWTRTAQGDTWTTRNPDGTGKVVFDSVNGTIFTTTLNADGSGKTTGNDGSWQSFDRSGRITDGAGPTDTRSGPKKFADGVGRAADSAGSLFGLGSHGVAESWQGLGYGTYRILSYPFRAAQESAYAAATYNPVTGTGYQYNPQADLYETIPQLDPNRWAADPWGMAGELTFDATVGIATSKIPIKIPGKFGGTGKPSGGYTLSDLPDTKALPPYAQPRPDLIDPKVPPGVIPSDYRPYGTLSPEDFAGKYWDPSVPAPKYAPDRPGAWNYPEKNGFELAPSGDPIIIDPDYRPAPGTQFDRFGNEFGRYLAPKDSPFGDRALPPNSLQEPYHSYEVTNVPLPADWTLQLGRVAPGFEQAGGGLQVYIIPPSTFSGPVLAELRRIGFLK
ncbi:glycohydrolase toxin TNT-related protein [Nocardia sp. NPDC052566]|uniref:glycohydrolase toxin TNT-related protein n=1 Tax=Nocardia sp. NPDC052566 TaxID=3364330 RepID=UPI0037CB9562